MFKVNMTTNCVNAEGIGGVNVQQISNMKPILSRIILKTILIIENNAMFHKWIVEIWNYIIFNLHGHHARLLLASSQLPVISDV